MSSGSAALAADAAQTSGKAVNLHLTAKTRAALADAYWNHSKDYSRGKVDGPKHVYYGKITGTTRAKDVYWAIGDIGVKGDPISYQDGPHVWRKLGNGGWRHMGDSGGCPQVPKKLLRLWKQPQYIC
ncbi:hypothetical protein [Sphaerisporangium fuscum]|uniref:hypothetical protein n=1 Tax=Sphaerisporangium fuscum TaxID=2835868 RepID=UPI001BDD6E7A|nr:hypothetical protein [Sphaerisporangium fuscum]